MPYIGFGTSMIVCDAICTFARGTGPLGDRPAVIALVLTIETGFTSTHLFDHDSLAPGFHEKEEIFDISATLRSSRR